ncbi:hypothetical protein M378DRAFT_19094 [Amanita muscaria Koide BX008]|uniref:Uncharacterized protein n=1 Tax=Amanita muscaria (strain Koide BX008) TaxID=946122 RepID=A0A0C2VZG5_AMAMK|nr:hypothetical protein M378DRAFT_19094 [Amanita muscaria Koide BX008]
MQTIRSSRWEASLRSPDFGLSYEQACKLSEAMLKDIGGKPDRVAKSSPVFSRTPVLLIFLTAFTTAFTAFVAVLFV